MSETPNTVCSDPVVGRIVELLDEQNKTQKQLLVVLGLPTSSFTKWRNGGTGYLRYISDIADYLNTTAEYLLTGNTPQTLTSTEKRLLEAYRSFSPADKQLADRLLEIIANCDKSAAAR